MNLDELVERVKTELRQHSSASSFADEIKEKLNEQMLLVLGDYDWAFLQTQQDFDLYADVTASCTMSTGDETVTLALGNRAHWAGHDIELTDGTTTLETTIARATDAGTQIELATAWTGSGSSGTVTVRFRKYRLPRDLQSITGLVDRDSRRVLDLLAGVSERTILLQKDETSTVPTTYLEETPAFNDRAPRKPMVGAISSGGNLVNGTTYRYLYVFYEHGRETGRSNIVEVTADAGNKTAALTALEDTSAFAPGRTKLVFRDEGDDAFYYLAEVAAGTNLYNDDGTTDPDYDRTYIEYGPYRYIRLWPRVSADRTIELHYRKQILPLIAGNDQPPFPGEFHHVLALLAAAVIAEPQGGKESAKAWRNIAAAQVRTMKNRYGSHRAERVIKQAFGARRRGRPSIGPITLE